MPVQQGQRGERVEEVEARDRIGLDDARQVEALVRAEQERDEGLDAAHEASGRRRSRPARIVSSQARGARIGDRIDGRIGLGQGNAPSSGLSVFPRMIGVAAGSRIGPESPAVTVLGHSQKQDGDRSSGRLWITSRVFHHSRDPRRPVDNSRGYTRTRWRPDPAGRLRSRSGGGSADPRLATPLRPRQRGGAGEDPRLLRCRVAIRTRRLPHLLERRRSGHRVVRARLLPAGHQPLPRADDAEAVARAQEEPQAALHAAAVPGDPREAVLRP